MILYTFAESKGDKTHAVDMKRPLFLKIELYERRDVSHKCLLYVGEN